MCGLFGYLGRGVNGETIRRLAVLAAQRGPDSWGMYENLDDSTIMVHHDGKLDLRFMDQIEGRRLVIGHCRLATSGSLGVIQPIECGKLVIAHNGNFYDAARIRPTLKEQPNTDCDTEVLGLAIEAGCHRKGLLGSTVSVMANRLKTSPTAILATLGRRVVAFAEDLPLFAAKRPEGTYFCSLAFEGATPIVGAKEFVAR
jgi:glutamine phosphoribosylpyrophosphate amidotransferase